MALAYTAPTWEDGSGTGISASQLQAICNCVEGLVQGTDKAVHYVEIDNSVITLTFADGTQETVVADIKGISTIEKTGSSGNVDTYTVTFSDGSIFTYTITNGADGEIPDISATAQVNNTTGTPSVTVTKSGTTAAPSFDFAFSNIKGEQGQQGQQGPTGADGQDGADGVSPTVTITAITGGTRVTITDKDHPSGQTFDVMNGTGAGDMLASVYDPQSAVATAGGIPAYVAGELPTVNDAALTIYQNETARAIFYANDSTDKTAYIYTDKWMNIGQYISGTVPSNGEIEVVLSAVENYVFNSFFFNIDGNSVNLNPRYELRSWTLVGEHEHLVFKTDADEGCRYMVRLSRKDNG